MSKVYTLFQTKTAPKALPFGAARTYMAYIGEYPPPGGELYTIKHALLIFYLFPKTQICFLFIYTLVWRELRRVQTFRLSRLQSFTLFLASYF